MSDKVADRLPCASSPVILLSVILLMMVFRSVAVPLKAAAMNLLSIGAAYGVIVAVFQWGWLKAWSVSRRRCRSCPFMPMMLFAVLFGLSMDYEVFLLTWVRGGVPAPTGQHRRRRRGHLGHRPGHRRRVS